MRGAIARRIRTIFPQLGNVEITEMFGGAIGQTVHGMPQIGQLRKGLWVASGFGRQGMNTSAMAGQLIARSILWGDERWRLFSPFELVWAGGHDRPGRRPSDRNVGAGQFRRRRRAGPLPRAGAGQGTADARRGWPKPTARPEPAPRPAPSAAAAGSARGRPAPPASRGRSEVEPASQDEGCLAIM